MIYEYDELERLLKIDDKTIYFEPKEHDVFKLLLKNEGKVVSYDDIDEVLTFGYGFNPHYKNTVMSRIRKKLGDSAELTNITRVGFKLRFLN